MQGGTNGREVNVLELRPFAGYTKALSANRINRHPLCIYVYTLYPRRSMISLLRIGHGFSIPPPIYTLPMYPFFSSSAIDLGRDPSNFRGYRERGRSFFRHEAASYVRGRVGAWIQQQWRVLAVAGIGRKKKKGEERKKKGMMGERPLNGTTFRGGRSTGRPYDVILHARLPRNNKLPRSKKRPEARRSRLGRIALTRRSATKKSFAPIYNRSIVRFARLFSRSSTRAQLVGCEAKVKGDGGYRWIGYRHARRRY